MPLTTNYEKYKPYVRPKVNYKKRALRVVKGYREKLVKGATLSEIRFKALLKRCGLAFEFQKIMDLGAKKYIVDFWLKDYHVVCEIDGGYHDTVEQKIKDDLRVSELLCFPLVSKVVRFDNEFILNCKKRDILKKLFPEFK